MTHPVPVHETIPDKPVGENDFKEVKDSIDRFNADSRQNLAVATNALTGFLGVLSSKVESLDKNVGDRLVELKDLGTKDTTERSQQSAAEVGALKAIDTTLTAVLTHVKAVDANDTSESFNKKELKCALAVGVLTGLMTLGTLGAWVTSIVQTAQAAQGNQPAPKTGDPTLDSKLADLYSFIKKTSDDEFWSQLAIYVGMQRSWTLYLTDQMAMMNYVIDWFPNFGVWVWASGNDKVGFVTQLVTAYQNSKSNPPAIYTTLNSFTYAGDSTQPGVAVKPPRAVGADLVRLALAQIIAAANNIK